MTIDYERDRRNDIKSHREEGIEEGMEKGRTMGIEEGKLQFVHNLIRETTFNNQKIASVAEIEESVVRRARSEMIRV